MNDISTKIVVSPTGVGVTGSTFSEPVTSQDVNEVIEDSKVTGEVSPPNPTELEINCEVEAKDETGDAQVDKVEEISEVIKCDSINEQAMNENSTRKDSQSENKTESKDDVVSMEVDEVTISSPPKQDILDDLQPSNPDETGNTEENVTKTNEEASILESLDLDDDKTDETEVLVVIEQKQDSNDEVTNNKELNLLKDMIQKINEKNNEESQMQVEDVSEKTCDVIESVKDKELPSKTEEIPEKCEQINIVESIPKTVVEVPLDSPNIDISKHIIQEDNPFFNIKVDEKTEKLNKGTVENKLEISRPSEAVTPDNISQINQPKVETKKSEMHLVKNIIIKKDSIRIPFVPKPEVKSRVETSCIESKPIKNVSNMQTVRKILENSENKSKSAIPSKDETKSNTTLNTKNADTIDTTKPILKIPLTTESSKLESKPEIKVRNLSIKTEPESKSEDFEMKDEPSVSDHKKANSTAAETKLDKKMNGDVTKDDQPSKRRASEEVDTDSPLKRLCMEVERTFPQHDTMINDFIQNATKNNIDEIQKHTEQLLTEIQTLRELAQKKEQEWNNILHLKKVKEEILLRLLRRKQVLSFEKSDLANLDRSKDTLEHLSHNKNLAIDKSDEISGVALKPPTTNPSPILQPPMMPPVSSHFNPLSGLPPPYDKVAHMQNMAKNMFPQSIMMPGPNLTGFPRDMNGQLNNMNNFNMPIGRQGPTKDVKSIIADYRQRNPDMVPRRGRRMKSILNPNMMNANQPRQIAPKLDNLSSLGMIFNNLDMNQKAMLERLTQMQGAGLPNGMSFKDVLVQFATMQNPNMMPRPDPMSCRPDLMSGRPDQMPGRPDQMPGRPDQMSGRPDQMPGRPDQMQGRPDQMQGRPDQIQSRPDQMSNRPDQMPGRPDQMLGRPEMLQNRPEPMPNRREESISRQETAHNRNERRRQERQSHHEEVQMKQTDRVATSSPRLPPPPYPEISLLPVNSQDGTQGPQQNSLLHGILTKPSSPAGQGYSPTLAKLLTSPESSNVATLPTLGQAKNCGEITITPVQPTPPPQESNAQEKTEEVVQLDEEEPSTWEGGAARNESPETGGGRLVIDEGTEPETPLCQGCRRRDAQFVCAGCANQWYCSRECQVAAWDEHSEMCNG